MPAGHGTCRALSGGVCARRCPHTQWQTQQLFLRLGRECNLHSEASVETMIKIDIQQPIIAGADRKRTAGNPPPPTLDLIYTCRVEQVRFLMCKASMQTFRIFMWSRDRAIHHPLAHQRSNLPHCLYKPTRYLTPDCGTVQTLGQWPPSKSMHTPEAAPSFM